MKIRPRHTEPSLVMILRLARARKHLWTLAWLISGRRTRSLAVDAHRPRCRERSGDGCSPLYAFSGLSINAPITVSICIRSVWMACEEWKRCSVI